MKLGAGAIAAVALSIAASGVAQADGYPVAKVPRAPAALWSGCYVGGDIGGAWTNQHSNINDPR
jgi:outer membrane immunogenic protein